MSERIITATRCRDGGYSVKIYSAKARARDGVETWRMCYEHYANPPLTRAEARERAVNYANSRPDTRYAEHCRHGQRVKQ